MNQKQLSDLRVCLMNTTFNVKEDLEFSDVGTCYLTEQGLEKILETLNKNEQDFKTKIIKAKKNLPQKPVEPDEYFTGIMNRKD